MVRAGDNKGSTWTPSGHVGLRARLLLALVASLCGGCFDGKFVQGLPCSDDSECGPELLCQEGLCGGKGTTAVCGNHKVEVDEECDGNSVDGVECTAECTFPSVCGNGEVEAGEDCDDGNTNEIDACTKFCTFTPEKPTLELSLEQVKQFRLHWQPVRGVEWYELYERVDENSEFVQVGEAIDKHADSYSLTVPLHFRVDASYKLVAYRSADEFDESVVDVTGNLANAIGYFKASLSIAGSRFGSSIALSDDGTTLAIGAIGESSIALGSGAVYVFVRAKDGAWFEQAHLKASNAASSDEFGASVALSGDGNTLAVGARLKNNDMNPEDVLDHAGAVYVFTRAGDVWTQQSNIPSQVESAEFGASIALSVDSKTLAVGSPGEDDLDDNYSPGSVYVFTREANSWTKQDPLRISNTNVDRFGQSVALSGSGNTLAIGAPGSPGAGVYIYNMIEGSWTYSFIEIDIIPSQNTNRSVSLSGDGETLAVGTENENVYVYTREDDLWVPQIPLAASNAEAGDWFGQSVALSQDGQTLVVGSWSEDSIMAGVNPGDWDNSASDSGAAYLFVQTEGVWHEHAYIKGPFVAPGYNFGEQVAISADGGTLVVGATGEGSAAGSIGGQKFDDSQPSSGAAYVY